MHKLNQILAPDEGGKERVLNQESKAQALSGELNVEINAVMNSQEWVMNDVEKKVWEFLHEPQPYNEKLDLDFGDNVQPRSLSYQFANILIAEGNGKAVAVNIEKFEGVHHVEIANKLIAAGHVRWVASNLEKFEGLNFAVAHKLIEAGKGFFVADNLEKFESLYHVEIANKLIEEGPGYVVAQFLEKFEGLDYVEIANKLIAAGEGYCVASNLEKFEGLDHVQIANKLINSLRGNDVAEYLEKFDGLNHVEVANKLFEAGQGDLVVEKLEKFVGLNHVEIANKLIEEGRGKAVAENLEKFKGLNHVDIANKLIEAGRAPFIAAYLEKFAGSNYVEFANGLYEHGKGQIVVEFIEKFKILNVDGLKDRSLAMCIRIFGEYFNFAVYSIVKSILEESLEQEKMSKIGITQLGDKGIEELRKRVSSYFPKFSHQNFRGDAELENPICSATFKAYVRFDKSQFGGQGDYEFRQMIRSMREKNIEPLSPEYIPSGEVKINKVQRNFEYSEQTVSRFTTIKGSVKKAIELLGEKKPLTEITKRLAQKIELLMADLRQKKEKQQNPKAIENIDRQIKKLGEIDLRSIKSLQSNFAELAKFDQLKEDLCVLLFYFTLREQPNMRDRIKMIIESEKIEFDHITTMIDFVEHVTNKEVWKDRLTMKEARKALNGLTNVTALEEDLLRMQKVQSGETEELNFVPTRGLLMEFSGHIADACWASKYDSIGEKFPNIFSVIMYQNKGTLKEQPIGAAMMIETESAEGEKLLVIRGLNPRENIINKLSVADFYKKFTDYGKLLAEKSGRKLAIVIDNHSGGSATNRPVLFNYLTQTAASLKKVQLKSEEDTTFNGYRITTQTYLV